MATARRVRRSHKNEEETQKEHRVSSPSLWTKRDYFFILLPDPLDLPLDLPLLRFAMTWPPSVKKLLRFPTMVQGVATDDFTAPPSMRNEPPMVPFITPRAGNCNNLLHRKMINRRGVRRVPGSLARKTRARTGSHLAKAGFLFLIPMVDKEFAEEGRRRSGVS